MPFTLKANEMECPTVKAVMSINRLRHCLSGKAITNKATNKI